jgi:peptidoglycan/LPS O-acetylase OafA/YrhL
MAHGDAADPDMARMRLRTLDGVRGLAACVVAFGFHAQYMFHAGAFAPGWGGPVVAWVHERGWTAVDLFFVLSGFIFAHVYLAGRGLTAAAGQADFAVARFARLYPLHLLTLFAAAWLFSRLPDNDPAAFAAHLTMTQALFSPVGHSFNGPSWSISVEMVCYLLFAAGAFWRPRAMPAIAAGAVAVGVAILLADPAEASPTVANALARGLVGFFVGQLLWHMRGVWPRVGTAWLVAAAIAGFLIDPGDLGPVPGLALLSWPALVLIALRTPALGAGWLQWLGDRSYAIYLSHMLFVDFVYHDLGGLDLTAANLVAGHALLILVALAVSDVLYRRFELPMRQAVRSRWSARRAALAGTR